MLKPRKTREHERVGRPPWHISMTEGNKLVFRHLSSPQCLVPAAMLCSLVLLPETLNSQAAGAQSTASPASAIYFPSGSVGGSSAVFTTFLRSVGETSLVAAAQDPNSLCYRFDWAAGQTGKFLAVRLSVNPDGSAEVTSIVVRYGNPPVINRTQQYVSNADVNIFLELVDKSDFWSISDIEKANPDLHGGSYTFDGDAWVFEGVRNGRYHVQLRRAPKSSRFTDLARFLAKDIANLDESVIPHPHPASDAGP